MMTVLLFLSMWFGIWVGAAIADKGVERDEPGMKIIGEIWIILNVILNLLAIVVENA